MASPSKKKFKKAVQEQILTNYYLSKYDRYMSNNNASYSSNLQATSKDHSDTKNKGRINFKHLIKQRKQESFMDRSRDSVERKNFRTEIQRKNSLQKESKENRKNFQRLEHSIINQLYTPSPSQLQSGKYHQIQIKHQTKYTDRPSQPFMLVSHEEEDAIQITNYENPLEEDSFFVTPQNNQYQRISQAIKTTFQKRSPSPKRNQQRKKSRSKNSPHKNQHFPPKNTYSEQFSNDQSVLFHENIRSTFQNLQKNNEASNGQKMRRKSIDKKDDDVQSRKSYRSSYSRKNSRQINSVERNKSSSRFKKSQAGSEKRSDKSYDDSLNDIIPVFPVESKETSDLAIEAMNQQASISDKAPTELRQSTHQLSMISRFSMTSDEGGLIREHLDRQINENEFGPYQNALSNLKDLIDEYPHAWPIFVVGQRILEDRQQYDGKRKRQEKEISKLQSQVNNEKAKQKRMLSGNISEVEKNRYRILRLVRQLGSKLQ